MQLTPLQLFYSRLFCTDFIEAMQFFAMTCILVIALVFAAEENKIIYVTFWFLVAYFTSMFVVTTIK